MGSKGIWLNPFEETECKCFGFQKFQKNWAAVGPWGSTCYGIPYDCKTYVFDN